MHLQSSKGLTPETSWELSSMKKALYFDAIQMFANSLKALKPVQNVSVDCKNGTAWRSGTQLINHLLEVRIADRLAHTTGFFFTL